MATPSLVDTPGSVLANTNRDFFNKNARAVFEQDWVRHLTGQITDALRSNLDSFTIRKRTDSGEPVRLLDYACGNGLASRALAPHVDVAVGVDVSEAMVELYNEASLEEGYSRDRMFAVQGNIMDGADISHTLPDAVYFRFDVAVLSMALHHVENPYSCVSKLVQRLQSGGVVIIIDWMPDSGEGLTRASLDDQDPVMQDIVNKSRMSFSCDEMRMLFVAAGCAPMSIDYHPYHSLSHLPEFITKIKGGANKRFFLAMARKI
ncbi:S-adenosyl-L-methionine-dependent methyltransferase [Diplogelasinospora grovesii]|uniref:S-adenosyl-L-methionine-dependent methyltransferase n=1 Tax=Diplogelasinospora grovesii TaxID=303347 RepID=A0AAN6S0H4_9PEZI|nr:S-adenosyl-L-methionine-dependent methyltransferase [Diplogelasinospora grovesii]